MRGSLIIVGFFVLGTIAGLFGLIPEAIEVSSLSFYALCGLMFCVGFSIGNDSNTINNLKGLNPKLILLPLITIVGTLIGSSLSSFFLEGR
ncbi:MAG: LysO family transporter, partial [Rikenellaceae bacterium]